MTTLAYIPFVDALPLHDIWYLLVVPMSIFLAIGYKAIRCHDLRRYPKEVLVFTAQILGGLALLAIAFTFVISYLLPILAPMPA